MERANQAIEAPSPARLFAALVGAALVTFGIVGFFYDSSFDHPGDVGDALGLLAVNGWANVFHIVTGALGLLLAGFASRRYALWLSALYASVAVLAALS
jgi:hypothetical protein